jgi:enoyl-CoA hydratase/carnithine racemase
MSGSVSVDKRGAVAVITLCNPQKRNALDPPMLDALCAALDTLPGEGVRAVVLTGEGDRAFSSGYDITALPSNASPSENPMARALAAISGGTLPVVAALNGVTIGGGCELAATCDLRVAHAQVTLTMPPVRLGIVYAPSGLQRFVALCGLSRTRELFLTAQPVPAERALAWGLVDRVVPAGEVLPTALALAEEIARGAPLALAGTRRVLEKLMPPLQPEVALELAELQLRAWTSEDAREARLAFVQKRPPQFTGR